jgi:hypothetical protein
MPEGIGEDTGEQQHDDLENLRGLSPPGRGYGLRISIRPQELKVSKARFSFTRAAQWVESRPSLADTIAVAARRTALSVTEL